MMNWPFQFSIMNTLVVFVDMDQGIHQGKNYKYLLNLLDDMQALFFNGRLSYYPNPLAGLLRTATIITNSTQQIVIIQELCPTFTPFDTLT